MQNIFLTVICKLTVMYMVIASGNVHAIVDITEKIRNNTISCSNINETVIENTANVNFYTTETVKILLREDNLVNNKQVNLYRAGYTDLSVIFQEWRQKIIAQNASSSMKENYFRISENDLNLVNIEEAQYKSKSVPMGDHEVSYPYPFTDYTHPRFCVDLSPISTYSKPHRRLVRNLKSITVNYETNSGYAHRKSVIARKSSNTFPRGKHRKLNRSSSVDENFSSQDRWNKTFLLTKLLKVSHVVRNTNETKLPLASQTLKLRRILRLNPVPKKRTSFVKKRRKRRVRHRRGRNARIKRGDEKKVTAYIDTLRLLDDHTRTTHGPAMLIWAPDTSTPSVIQQTTEYSGTPYEETSGRRETHTTPKDAVETLLTATKSKERIITVRITMPPTVSEVETDTETSIATTTPLPATVATRTSMTPKATTMETITEETTTITTPLPVTTGEETMTSITTVAEATVTTSLLLTTNETGTTVETMTNESTVTTSYAVTAKETATISVPTSTKTPMSPTSATMEESTTGEGTITVTTSLPATGFTEKTIVTRTTEESVTTAVKTTMEETEVTTTALPATTAPAINISVNVPPSHVTLLIATTAETTTEETRASAIPASTMSTVPPSTTEITTETAVAATGTVEKTVAATTSTLVSTAQTSASTIASEGLTSTELTTITTKIPTETTSVSLSSTMSTAVAVTESITPTTELSTVSTTTKSTTELKMATVETTTEGTTPVTENLTTVSFTSTTEPYVLPTTTIRTTETARPKETSELTTPFETTLKVTKHVTATETTPVAKTTPKTTSTTLSTTKTTVVAKTTKRPSHTTNITTTGRTPTSAESTTSQIPAHATESTTTETTSATTESSSTQISLTTTGRSSPTTEIVVLESTERTTEIVVLKSTTGTTESTATESASPITETSSTETPSTSTEGVTTESLGVTTESATARIASTVTEGTTTESTASATGSTTVESTSTESPPTSIESTITESPSPIAEGTITETPIQATGNVTIVTATLTTESSTMRTSLSATETVESTVGITTETLSVTTEWPATTTESTTATGIIPINITTEISEITTKSIAVTAETVPINATIEATQTTATSEVELTSAIAEITIATTEVSPTISQVSEVTTKLTTPVTEKIPINITAETIVTVTEFTTESLATEQKEEYTETDEEHEEMTTEVSKWKDYEEGETTSETAVVTPIETAFTTLPVTVEYPMTTESVTVEETTESTTIAINATTEPIIVDTETTLPITVATEATESTLPTIATLSVTTETTLYTASAPPEITMATFTTKETMATSEEIVTSSTEEMYETETMHDAEYGTEESYDEYEDGHTDILTPQWRDYEEEENITTKSVMETTEKEVIETGVTVATEETYVTTPFVTGPPIVSTVENQTLTTGFMETEATEEDLFTFTTIVYTLPSTAESTPGFLPVDYLEESENVSKYEDTATASVTDASLQLELTTFHLKITTDQEQKDIRHEGLREELRKKLKELEATEQEILEREKQLQKEEENWELEKSKLMQDIIQRNKQNKQSKGTSCGTVSSSGIPAPGHAATASFTSPARATTPAMTTKDMLEQEVRELEERLSQKEKKIIEKKNSLLERERRLQRDKEEFKSKMKVMEDRLEKGEDIEEVLRTSASSYEGTTRTTPSFSEQPPTDRTTFEIRESTLAQVKRTTTLRRIITDEAGEDRHDVGCTTKVCLDVLKKKPPEHISADLVTERLCLPFIPGKFRKKGNDKERRTKVDELRLKGHEWNEGPSEEDHETQQTETIDNENEEKRSLSEWNRFKRSIPGEDWVDPELGVKNVEATKEEAVWQHGDHHSQCIDNCMVTKPMYNKKYRVRDILHISGDDEAIPLQRKGGENDGQYDFGDQIEEDLIEGENTLPGATPSSLNNEMEPISEGEAYTVPNMVEEVLEEQGRGNLSLSEDDEDDEKKETALRARQTPGPEWPTEALTAYHVGGTRTWTIEYPGQGSPEDAFMEDAENMEEQSLDSTACYYVIPNIGEESFESPEGDYNKENRFESPAANYFSKTNDERARSR